LKILITGVAGFIGFNLALDLLKKKQTVYIVGIDNINSYYSQKLKKYRLNELAKYKNFKFHKINIEDESKLSKVFKTKFNFVVHLAAQAGVRYSIINPDSFVKSNIKGFFNILKICKDKKIKKLIYASSSSVYGENKNFPLKESMNINPKNFYAMSKKNNEEMAEIFSKFYGLNIIGLRFFTVFGEWGRPDMFMMKYLKSSFFKKSKFYLYNYGNHLRDFTYINDVTKIINLIIKKNKFRGHKIFNICSNKPIKITKVINLINQITKKNPKFYKTSLQKADVIKTHGSNTKICNFTGFKEFTNLKYGLTKTIDWFKKYNKI